MSQFLVQKAASFKIGEIYRYTLTKWGKLKAKEYINEMFDAFAMIEKNKVFSRPIPSEFCIHGFYFQYKKHYVYWKYLKSGDIGIVTILHQRMHQLKQFENIQENGD